MYVGFDINAGALDQSRINLNWKKKKYSQTKLWKNEAFVPLWETNLATCLTKLLLSLKQQKVRVEGNVVVESHLWGQVLVPLRRIPPIFCRLRVDSPSVSPFSLFIPRPHLHLRCLLFFLSRRLLSASFIMNAALRAHAPKLAAPGYHFIFLLLFISFYFIFFWSRLRMTCPRQRSSRPTLIIFSHSASRRHNGARAHTHAFNFFFLFSSQTSGFPLCACARLFSAAAFCCRANMGGCQSRCPSLHVLLSELQHLLLALLMMRNTSIRCHLMLSRRCHTAALNVCLLKKIIPQQKSF